MIALNIKYAIALLVLGFMAGLCAMFLLNGCGDSYTVAPARVITTEDLRKKAGNLEVVHEHAVNVLINRNHHLVSRLKATREQLALAKTKTRKIETRISEVISARENEKGVAAKDLLANAGIDSAHADLVVEQWIPQAGFCDTLATEVIKYIEETNQKDSLQETQAAIQDSIIVAKDSIISVKNNHIESLHSVFNESITQQDFLQKENKSLRKQFKRQKFKSTVKTVGFIILSGIVTHYTLNN